MSGILYGVSVGPGDPQLLTLKAVEIIRSCGIIAAPYAGESTPVALDIARRAVPEVWEKETILLHMPMTRDAGELERTRREAVTEIATLLKTGKDVAFLTLGDVSIYSTYMYLHHRVKELGFAAEMIAGVPSFCAAAARLGESLTEAHQPLHIIPASYAGVDEGLDCAGTRVLMKTGKSIESIKEKLRERGLYSHAKMVQKCGMAGERVYETLDDAHADSSYFSVIIVKE